MEMVYHNANTTGEASEIIANNMRSFCILKKEYDVPPMTNTFGKCLLAFIFLFIGSWTFVMGKEIPYLTGYGMFSAENINATMVYICITPIFMGSFLASLVIMLLPIDQRKHQGIGSFVIGNPFSGDLEDTGIILWLNRNQNRWAWNMAKDTIAKEGLSIDEGVIDLCNPDVIQGNRIGFLACVGIGAVLGYAATRKGAE